MLENLPPITDVICRLGGTSATARLLGVPISTVHYWKRLNKLPHWRVPQIKLALATLCDFEDRTAPMGAA